MTAAKRRGPVRRFFGALGRAFAIMDWLRTIRSTLGYFGGSSRIQGGSTITQQVIKNLTGNDEVTPERKVQEIFTALKLEKNYSKEQILETYKNED